MAQLYVEANYVMFSDICEMISRFGDSHGSLYVEANVEMIRDTCETISRLGVSHGFLSNNRC
jgi:hypothetical protein